MIDATTIEAAAGGDRAAFRAIYEAYLREVTVTVGRYAGPGPELEDIVQEVFLALHRSLSKVKEPEKFGGWVHRVARNVAISHVRKRPQAVQLVVLNALRDPVSLWKKLHRREKLRILYAALDCLGEEHREAVIMYEIEGMTLQEIADETDTSINTIASRVRRGREQLVKIIKNLQGQRAEEKQA